jgi:hypothetical protein
MSAASAELSSWRSAGATARATGWPCGAEAMNLGGVGRRRRRAAAGGA